MNSDLRFHLNGEAVTVVSPDPNTTLAEYLHSVGLTGTKVACGQGGCGACTVMVSQALEPGAEPWHRAVNACLKPLCSVAGCAVTTAEGLGDVHHGMDKAQVCIAANNGTQCGFCTPGIAVNAHVVLRNHPRATQQELEDSFGGNICRCTGYRPILHGVRTLASDYEPSQDSTPACLVDPMFAVKVRPEPVSVTVAEGPTELLHFSARGREWIRPTSLEEARRLKAELVAAHGAAEVKLVVGNTSVGVYPQELPRFLLDVSHLHELNTLQETEEGLVVGASVPIQRLVDKAAEVVVGRPAEQTTGFRELRRHGLLIAGTQVRSAGSVAGNIMLTLAHVDHHEPFPSDLFTILATLGTKARVLSSDYPGGTAELELWDLPAPDRLPADALILHFVIPYSQAEEKIQTYRVARRRQNSHAIVTGGFRCRLDQDGKARDAIVVFGGLASMLFRCPATEAALEGKSLDHATLRSALSHLGSELEERTIDMEGEGIGTPYRKNVARNFFYRFYLHATSGRGVDPRHQSGAEHYLRPLSQGQHSFPQNPDLFPVTLPIIKRAAFVQATGELRFAQDLTLPVGGYHGAIVKSTRPHARFSFKDGLEEELKSRFPGFKALATAADVPGARHIGLGQDDPVFCERLATSVGARLAMVLADSAVTAREAALFVESEVEYEELPAVVTLDQAIEQDTQFYELYNAPHHDLDIQQRLLDVTRPESDLAWLEQPEQPLDGAEVVSGTVRTTAQAHFHLETVSCLAIPGAYDQMTVHSSTQNPNGDQANIAAALGVKANQVTMVVGHIGGGFGAKQNRAALFGAATAVAARKVGRPVRLALSRSEEMQMVGKRHPYLGRYHLAYTPDGVLQGLRLHLDSDAGDTYDCSFAVMDLSLLMADACYKIDTYRASGNVYRTHKTSNTAFRTFGTVQPHVILEDAVEHAAHELSRQTGQRVLAETLRRKNFYKTGTIEDHDTAPYGQGLPFCNITAMWDSLLESSDFFQREEAVAKFNRENRFRKRGICVTPHKYGIAFTEPRGSLNASSALVNVNASDGSVTVIHGGVEMGQGLHTKIAQVAAQALGVPLELIRVGDNNSDVIVNAPATAASTGFDLNAGAVDLACKALRQRLVEFCETLEQYIPQDCVQNWRTDWAGNWNEIILRAWSSRINLGAQAIYKSPHYYGPGEGRDRVHPFLYYVWSVACSEVEIDVLSGEFEVLRADLLYDAGQPPNPAIDIGQLEGAYVQGLGMMTTEEPLYAEDGRLITDNTWNYKPPCSKTIPQDFRVRLLEPGPELALQVKSENLAVKASKTSGEPGLVMAVSAFLAIKRAVLAARQDLNGDDSWFRMDLPATSEKIQTLCELKPEHLKL